MPKVKFVDGQTATAEVNDELFGSNIVQIALLESTYEDVLKLFKEDNFDNIELFDDEDNKVKDISGYSKLASILTLFPTKVDFWMGCRIVVVLEKN